MTLTADAGVIAAADGAWQKASQKAREAFRAWDAFSASTCPDTGLAGETCTCGECQDTWEFLARKSREAIQDERIAAQQADALEDAAGS